MSRWSEDYKQGENDYERGHGKDRERDRWSSEESDRDYFSGYRNAEIREEERREELRQEELAEERRQHERHLEQQAEEQQQYEQQQAEAEYYAQQPEPEPPV